MKVRVFSEPNYTAVEFTNHDGETVKLPARWISDNGGASDTMEIEVEVPALRAVDVTFTAEGAPSLFPSGDLTGEEERDQEPEAEPATS